MSFMPFCLISPCEKITLLGSKENAFWAKSLNNTVTSKATGIPWRFYEHFNKEDNWFYFLWRMHFSFLKYLFSKCVVCTYLCVHMWVQMPTESRRGYQILWSYQWLSAAYLRSWELNYSARAICDLNLWNIYPAWKTHFSNSYHQVWDTR